jgi:hypothetical protein
MPGAGLKRSSPSEPGERIWRYVVVSDTGFAPCVDRGLLTLCTCKPAIRRGAQKDDWVIGWTPKRLGADRIVWVGQVDRVLTLGDYKERYANRRDAIYKRVGYEPDGRERLLHTGAKEHNTRRHWETDRSGRNALTFRKFWYWGASAPRAEGLADLAHHHIGQTCRQVRPDDVRRLEEWLERQGPPGVHGRPRTPSSVKNAADHKLVRAHEPAVCTRVRARCGA